MCKISRQEIEAMTDEEMVSHIRAHRARSVQLAVGNSKLTADMSKVEDDTIRRELDQFVKQEIAAGTCDPVRVERRDSSFGTEISAETYILSPDIVEDIIQRLSGKGWKPPPMDLGSFT